MNNLQVWLPALAVAAAYLIGSLSFAVIVSKAMGLNDPRNYGSGNPGATNVLRSGNKKAALFTLLFDALKGYLPTMAAVLAGPHYMQGEGLVAGVGLAAFLGHLYPVFFRFKGGKGVATALGVLLGISPLLGAMVLLTWLLVAFLGRYSSLAALTAALLAPFYQWWLAGQAGPITCAVAFMSVLLFWRHRGNIRKLLAGTESRIGGKALAESRGGNPQA